MHAPSSVQLSRIRIKINFQRSRKKTKWYPVSKITILFSAWHVLLTYFNNSIKLIWNYKEGEGQSSISLTPSAHFVEKLDNWSEKRKQELLVCSRILPLQLDIASEFVQHLGGMGLVRGGPRPPWILIISAKKVVFFVSSGKKQFFPHLASLVKFWKNP